MCFRLIALTALVICQAILFSTQCFAQEIPNELAIALEDALAERTVNLQKRLEVVDEIDHYLSVQESRLDREPDSHPTLRTEIGRKSRFLRAATHMWLNQVELANTEIAELMPHVDPNLEQELWFRCRSLEAAILLVRGMKEQSLNAFQSLLTGNLHCVSEAFVDRARINYAAALNENGRMGAATELYESIMLDALERQNDQSALHAGNNLIGLLIMRGDTQAASRVLSELKGVLARQPKSILTESLHLRELGLMLEAGDHEACRVGLNDFIHQSNPPPPLLLGTAHKYLANLYLEQGQLELAHDHAAKSVSLTNNNAYELEGAQVMLARVLIAKKEYESAFGLLDRIDLSREGGPNVRKLVSQFKLEAKLRMEGREDEAELLKGMVDADQMNENIRSQSVLDYFEAKMAAVRRKLSAKQSEAESLVLAKANQVSVRNRNLWYGLLSVLGLCSCLLIYIPFRRIVEQSRQAEQKALSEKLESMVEQKTRELKANLEVQAKMAKAIEHKKRVETIGLLAGKIAHDMNNLLQVIANANQVISNAKTDEFQRAQLLQLSNQSLHHGTSIIRQLLAFSRQEEPSSRELNFSRFLEENSVLFRSALGSHIELTIQDASQGALINVDPSRLTTALLNLFSNSADAMGSEGKVRLEAKCIAIKDGESNQWSQLSPNEYLDLSICDTGCGMNEEQIAKAFEPFFSTKGIGKGTGLGLSSVHDFVKQSGGDIKIQCKSGGETRVRILLPLVKLPTVNFSATSLASEEKKCVPLVDSSRAMVDERKYAHVFGFADTSDQTPFSNSSNSFFKEVELERDAQISYVPPASAPEVSLTSKRILIVEDNESLARSLMMLVRHLEMQYEWSPTGDDAKQRLQSDPRFDFVLSDVNMPGTLNGPKLVAWIRSELPQIQAFLMSGYSDVEFESQNTPLLNKPFTLIDLKCFLTNGSR